MESLRREVAQERQTSSTAAAEASKAAQEALLDYGSIAIRLIRP